MSEPGISSPTIAGDVAHLVVLVVAADVDRDAGDALGRGLGERDEGAGDVVAVDQGPPRRAVAHDADLAVDERRREQVVDDEVDAEHGRVAVRGRVAEEHRCEAVAGEPADRGLGLDLRLRVGGERVQLGVLVEVERRALAVDGAAAGEEEARHAGLLREPGEPDRGVPVHGQGQRRVDVAHRVVRDRGEVHDGVVALEVVRGERAHVLRELPVGGGERLPAAALEEADVAAGDVVAGGLEDRGQVRADVAAVAGDEDLHAACLLEVMSRWSAAWSAT